MIDRESDVALAHWIVAHKRRWPLSLIVFAGAGLAVYCLLVTQGRLAALARLSQDRADIVALAPTPVPLPENAASHWIEMHAEMRRVSFEGTLNGKKFSSGVKLGGNIAVGPSVLTLQKDEWRNPASYGKGEAVRTWLDLSKQALSAGHEAAALPKCNWNLNYAQANGEGLFGNMAMRDCARLFAAQARVAAFDNDWATAEKALRAMGRTADNANADRSEMNFIIATAIDEITVNALEDCLAIAPTPPSTEQIQRLRAFCLQRHEAPLHLAETNEATKRFARLKLDQIAAGQDPWRKYSSSDSLVLLDSRPIFAAMSAQLTARCYDAVIASARDLEHGGRYQLTNTDSIDGDARAHMIFLDYIPLTDRLKLSWVLDRAQWRTAVAGLSALEYRATHNPQWPATLADLAIDADLKKDPIDPEQRPLQIMVSADGRTWTVTSIKQDDYFARFAVSAAASSQEKTQP